MIKTLKSELKLRPTYDEMIGMIQDADKENRPPIEQIIDRRATLFRNNQFGSQFDNIDFLGLKKQEEDRAKEEARRATLRHAGIMAGTSTASQSVNSSDFSTPVENYDMNDEKDDEYERANAEITRIRTVFEREIKRQEEAQQALSSWVRGDLDEAHRQSIPAGVPVHSMDTDDEDDMPPLETPTEVAEEEEEEDEEIDFNTDINYWRTKSSEELMKQIQLRGLKLVRMDKNQSEQDKKKNLLGFIKILIENGEWVKKQPRPPPTETLVPSQQASSSSSTLRDIAVSGAKAGVETLAKAGATALAKSFLPV